MPPRAPLMVRLIASTSFAPPTDVEWSTDATGAEALIEFAGRACYESWDKPNPATATNRAYLHHVMDVGHHALLEHATATFYVTGLSRSCAHEIVRHRHLSCSQLSARYVPEGGPSVVVPAGVAATPRALDLFAEAARRAHAAYEEVLEALLEEEGVPEGARGNTGTVGTEGTGGDESAASLGAGGTPGTPRRRGVGSLRFRQLRQAARSLLPDATETRMVITANFRAYRHFLAAHATEHADLELREVAIALLRPLQEAAPAVFEDFVISSLPDGTEIATSPRVGEI